MSKAEAAQWPTFAGEAPAQHRAMCHGCRRPRVACYCALIEPFDSAPRFIILSQPREARHRLGTGRPTHRCLRNSVLLEGVDFSRDRRVNDEIVRPGALPFLLYPGEGALSLSRQPPNRPTPLTTVRQFLVIFVLDGPWKSARHMLRSSPNLAALPRLCFEPAVPSSYKIRRQPKAHCYSTVEAIHFVLDWFAQANDPVSWLAVHDNLLTVFRAMVARQLAYNRR